MKHIALSMIRCYQRWISPYKGFCCAYRSHTGADSCSAFGYRAIERRGVITGVQLLRRRLNKCADVHAMGYLNPAAATTPYRPRAQAGDCDPGCDLIPGIDCHSGRAGSLCDAADCCSSGCDLFDNRDRKAARAQRRAERKERKRENQSRSRS